MGGSPLANIFQNETMQKVAAVLQQIQKQKQAQSSQTPAQVPQAAPTATPPFVNPGGGGGAPSGGGGGATGQYPMPVARPPRQPMQQPPGSDIAQQKLDPHGAAVFNAIQGVSQVLQQFESRKDQKDSAEAANIAQNLMQALDASNSNDPQTRNNAIATVHEILNDKHSTKILNKVYKGWLQKSQEAQKANQASEPDPTVQGFEKGLSEYTKGKNQGTPLPMPQTMGGYRLPQAGPAQQAKTNVEKTAAITTQQDLERAQAGQPTMAQKAEQDKYNLETEKYKTQVRTAAVGYLKAQTEAKKAELDLQTKQVELKLTEKKGEISKQLDDARLQKANVDLDIAKTRLALLKATPPKMGGQKEGLPSPALLKPINAANQAASYVESVLNTRGDKGFTQEDVQALTGMLQQAGASGLAKSLPGWLGRHAPAWAGGSGKDDVQSMLDSINQYKSGLETTIQERYPSWQGSGSAKASATEEDPDAGPGEGESDEPDADIVVSPEDLKD